MRVLIPLMACSLVLFGGEAHAGVPWPTISCQSKGFRLEGYLPSLLGGEAGAVIQKDGKTTKLVNESFQEMIKGQRSDFKEYVGAAVAEVSADDSAFDDGKTFSYTVNAGATRLAIVGKRGSYRRRKSSAGVWGSFRATIHGTNIGGQTFTIEGAKCKYDSRL